jgi:dihydrofolate reductase
MELVLIAAVGENNVIGKDNSLAWRNHEDMKRFRDMTRGHAVLMGRKTYESIGKPLQKRENFVLTHDPNFNPGGVIIAHGLQDVLKYCQDFPLLFCIGGEQLYQKTIDLAQRLEITKISRHLDGNKYFPSIDSQKWDIEKEEHGGEDFTYLTYRRRK